MRDEYVGDIGDFGKYVLLNSLADIVNGQYKIGINWYYNTKPSDTYAYLDDASFDTYSPNDNLRIKLRSIVTQHGKKLSHVLNSDVLRQGFIHYHKEILHNASSSQEREDWFRESKAAFGPTDIIFLDPDNGIQTPKVKTTHAKALKYAFIEKEIIGHYKQGKSVIVYHHKDRSSQDSFLKKVQRAFKDKADQLRVFKFTRRPIRYYIFLVHDAHTHLFGKLVQNLTSPPKPLFEDIMRGQTTHIGYENRNGQVVLKKTAVRGTDHNQFVYILKCKHCKRSYGANGSDIWQRRCPAPKSQCPSGGGQPGI